MLPLLLISNNKKIIKKYLNQIIAPEDLFFELKPEGTKYLISQIKEVVRQIFVFNPKKRVYFFPDFHLSTLEAQNAFLKSLEEAPSNVLFILTTDSAQRLLPTLVSRTKVIVLDKKITPVLNSTIQKQLQNLLIKKQFRTINLSAFEVKDKEEAGVIVNQIIFFFQNRLRKEAEAAVILKEILWQKSLLENNNLTPQLTIDHILTFIFKTYNMKL